ncbi:hypothetical protein [Promicromonospora sukumoe]
MTTRQKPSSAITAIALVALTTLFWWLFLGRDIADPAGGHTYEPVGVLVCGILLTALVVGGSLLVPAWLAVVAVALPFTLATGIQAASIDDSGLWAVGTLIVLVGAFGGGAIVAAVTRGVVHLRRTVAA